MGAELPSVGVGPGDDAVALRDVERAELMTGRCGGGCRDCEKAARVAVIY